MLRRRAELVHVPARLERVVLGGRHQADRHRERRRPTDGVPHRSARRPGADPGPPEPPELALADRAVAHDDLGRARRHRHGGVVDDRTRRVAAARIERDVPQVTDAQRLCERRRLTALTRVDAEPVDVGQRETGVLDGPLHRLTGELELGAASRARFRVLGLADADDAGAVTERPRRHRRHTIDGRAGPPIASTLMTPRDAVRLVDVAKRAGVTVSTASRALARPEMVRPETRSTRRAGRRRARLRTEPRRSQLDHGPYRCDRHHRAGPREHVLRTHRTRRAGVRRARAYEVLIVDTGDDTPQRELEIIESAARWVDGLILCAAKARVPADRSRVADGVREPAYAREPRRGARSAVHRRSPARASDGARSRAHCLGRRAEGVLGDGAAPEGRPADCGRAPRADREGRRADLRRGPRAGR